MTKMGPLRGIRRNEITLISISTENVVVHLFAVHVEPWKLI